MTYRSSSVSSFDTNEDRYGGSSREAPEPTYAATVAHRLTTVLLIVSVAFGLFLAGQAVTGKHHTVTFAASAALDQHLLPKGAYPTSDQRTGFAIRSPSDREQRLAAVKDLLPLALWIAMLVLLQRIARSVRDGDPFIAANVRRLRAIGALLVVGVLAVHFADRALQDALLDPYLRPLSAFDEPGLRPPDGDFPGTALLAGLGVFVLAQVFAHGVALREDVEATI